MNVYIFDSDPKKSVSYLCDSHLVRGTGPICTWLANCFDINTLFLDAPRTKDGKIRKHGLEANNCSGWAKASEDNRMWLAEYCNLMLDEYHRRFSNHNAFSPARQFVNWVIANTKGDSDNRDGYPFNIPDSACCRLHPEFESLDIFGKNKLFYVIDEIYARWRFDKPNWYLSILEEDKLVHKLRIERMKRE